LGYDPIYGARPLRRIIQNHVEDRFAEDMLDGKIKSGDSILLDFVDNTLKFVNKAKIDILKK